MTDDDYEPTDAELMALQAELEALEATDIDVARASWALDEAVARILRQSRLPPPPETP